MIIKVGDDILDFNGDIDIEKNSKLFEQINDTKGDFSYTFEIPFTSINIKILTVPLADVLDKKIYRYIDCDLLDTDGYLLYKGFIRVDRTDYEHNKFDCSFFSGNANWITLLAPQISDINFTDFDTIVNIPNIENSWSNTDGLVFGFVDSGNLITRRHNRTIPEEWVPQLFCKTIFKSIFNSHSIKVEGDLLNDFIFNNLLICGNTHNEQEIEDRTVYVGKTVEQDVTASGTIITFDSLSYPYNNSVNNNFDLPNNRYISDASTKLKIEFNFQYVTGLAQVELFKNGVAIADIESLTTGSTAGVLYVNVIPGDYIQFVVIAFFPVLKILSGTLKITPIFLYDIKGRDIVPKWSQAQFIKNVLSLFNVCSDYDVFSKTLTINFFDGIKQKEPIQLPDTIQVENTDFVEFISNYGKNNYFKYKNSDDEDIRKYNVNTFIEYGQGNIIANNDYLQLSITVLDSDFSAPLSYINLPFGSMSMERMKIFTIESSNSVNITGINNNSGYCRFNTDQDVLQSGDLVTLEMDHVTQYDGDWVVSNVGAGYFDIIDAIYIAGDTGVAKIDIIKTSNNDSVFLFVNTGQRPVSDFSNIDRVYISNTPETSIVYNYFNLLNINKPINTIFKQGLSFGSINNNLSYQRSLLDTYWTGFQRVLNDPVKLYVSALLPKVKFTEITSLRPTFIETEQSSNLYYVNRITSYKNSYTACTMELIKL